MASLTHRLFVEANQISLDDSNIDDATKQQIRSKRLDVSRRLEDCATSHASNIHNGKPPGAHVRIIHQALMRLRSAGRAGTNLSLDDVERQGFDDMVAALRNAPGIGDDEWKTGVYGPTTQALVLAYKTARNIRLTPRTAVDRVVGIQTIKSLDADLNLADAKPMPRPTPPPGVVRPIGIFIKFSGFGAGVLPGSKDKLTSDLFVKTFSTDAYLATHNAPMVETFFGGRGAQDPTDEVVKRVKAMREQIKDGVTVVVGFSAGGFSVLNTAAKLTALGIRLDFVGLADGAFFAEDGDVLGIGPARIKPPGTITAARTLNTFQQLGHEVLRKSGGNAMGLQPGTEVHGSIPGLTDDELTSANDRKIDELARSMALSMPHPAMRKKLISDPAHIRAVAVGQDRIHAVVSTLFLP